jgi:hypothetical protein
MEISLGEAITMTARNKPDAPSFVFADGSAHTFAQTNARVNLLRRAMDTFGCDFLNAFGAGTEAGLQAVLTPEDHRVRAGRPPGDRAERRRRRARPVPVHRRAAGQRQWQDTQARAAEQGLRQEAP